MVIIRARALPNMDGFTDAAPAPTLPRASDEQKEAVRALSRGHTIIESVAGSGKTTTVLFFAKVFATRSALGKSVPGARSIPTRILLLTYNAKLKFETRERAAAHGFDHLEVHSYHSFAVRYCSPDGYTDRGIMSWLGGIVPGFDDHIEPIRPLPQYDIIVVDEAQDMNFVYHDMVKRIMAASPHARLCVLGDKSQSIYGFNGADPRFISLASQVFSVAPGVVPGAAPNTWSRTPLSTSYRITRQMCDWLNQLGCPHMAAVKDGVRPEYIYADREDTILVVRIASACRRLGASNVFILAPSIRGSAKSSVNQLSNMLSRSGIPIFMPNSDAGPLDEEIIRGKLVFSSFHQAKGLERQAVFVLGVDQSYYTYYNTSAPVDRCPNELYVAMTRASSELTIVHWAGHDYAPFIREDMLAVCTVTGDIKAVERTDIAARTISVTDLTRHHSSVDIEVALSRVKIITVSPAGVALAIPTKAAQVDGFGDATYEDVSDINGTALPLHYELSLRKGANAAAPTTLYEEIPATARAGLIWPPRSPAHLLNVAAVYLATRNALEYKVRQISRYDWLEADQLAAATARMAAVIPADAVFETGYTMRIGGRTISGRIDALTATHIYEIKCVSAITSEHILQVCIYALMLHGITPRHARAISLYNVSTGEHLRIEADLDALTHVCKTLIHSKYHGRIGMSDADFLLRAGSTDPATAPCAECAGTWSCSTEVIPARVNRRGKQRARGTIASKYRRGK